MALTVADRDAWAKSLGYGICPVWDGLEAMAVSHAGPAETAPNPLPCIHAGINERVIVQNTA